MEQNVNNIENNIKEKLNKFVEKEITIIQDGFLKSKFSLNKVEFFIEYDILNINDKESNNYLKINLNQIYKIENTEIEVKISLDNDTEIILKIKEDRQ